MMAPAAESSVIVSFRFERPETWPDWLTALIRSCAEYPRRTDEVLLRPWGRAQRDGVGGVERRTEWIGGIGDDRDRLGDSAVGIRGRLLARVDLHRARRVVQEDCPHEDLDGHGPVGKGVD